MKFVLNLYRIWYFTVNDKTVKSVKQSNGDAVLKIRKAKTSLIPKEILIHNDNNKG